MVMVAVPRIRPSLNKLASEVCAGNRDAPRALVRRLLDGEALLEDNRPPSTFTEVMGLSGLLGRLNTRIFDRMCDAYDAETAVVDTSTWRPA